MRMYPRAFPSGRRRKPKRRAERQIYEALAGIDRRGFVYYEWRRGHECIELDFAVWIEGLGRFALQVKGGRYLLIDGELRLKTRDGVQPISTSLLDEAWLAALDLHDDVQERARTSYNPFVVPVLLFPDMTEPDESIENLAKRKGVYVIWGTRDLLADLERIVRGRRVSDRLTMERIAAEVLAVTDGQICLDAVTEADNHARSTRPLVLSLSVGSCNVLEVRMEEMHMRFGNRIGPGTSRKGRRQC